MLLFDIHEKKMFVLNDISANYGRQHTQKNMENRKKGTAFCCHFYLRIVLLHLQQKGPFRHEINPESDYSGNDLAKFG